MDKRLEEIQEKFDELDRSLSAVAERTGMKKNSLLIHFLGSINGRAKLGEDVFESFYDAIRGDLVLPIANEYLSLGGANVPPITEEDIKYLYEALKGKIGR